MNDKKDWLWLVKTDKGDFFITVWGNWTQEEAAKKLQLVFDKIKLNITAMIPRKRATGDMDTMGTIIQYGKDYPPGDHTDSGLEYQFLGGKKLWEVCGRGVEYEAELIRVKKEEGI